MKSAKHHLYKAYMLKKPEDSMRHGEKLIGYLGFSRILSHTLPYLHFQTATQIRPHPTSNHIVYFIAAMHEYLNKIKLVQKCHLVCINKYIPFLPNRTSERAIPNKSHRVFMSLELQLWDEDRLCLRCFWLVVHNLYSMWWRGGSKWRGGAPYLTDDSLL